MSLKRRLENLEQKKRPTVVTVWREHPTKPGMFRNDAGTVTTRAGIRAYPGQNIVIIRESPEPKRA